MCVGGEQSGQSSLGTQIEIGSRAKDLGTGDSRFLALNLEPILNVVQGRFMGISGSKPKPYES